MSNIFYWDWLFWFIIYFFLYYFWTNIKIVSETRRINNNLINNKQLYPVSGKYLDISHFDTHEIAITEDKVDLVCSGYCIITLRNFKNTTVKVYVPKNVDVNLVDSLI